jgi:hypothetical protein
VKTQIKGNALPALRSTTRLRMGTNHDCFPRPFPTRLRHQRKEDVLYCIHSVDDFGQRRILTFRRSASIVVSNTVDKCGQFPEKQTKELTHVYWSRNVELPHDQPLATSRIATQSLSMRRSLCRRGDEDEVNAVQGNDKSDESEL